MARQPSVDADQDRLARTLAALLPRGPCPVGSPPFRRSRRLIDRMTADCVLRSLTRRHLEIFRLPDVTFRRVSCSPNGRITVVAVSVTTLPSLEEKRRVI
jgi:hypothetical protein